ncbi:MAG: 3-oxoacyl-[acyl-carrier-protein] reductase [Firmicutes bacterium]|nr:3-oxoacyl-[acyl-carrier-protein] reductase [Bacillota bacterium]
MGIANQVAIVTGATRGIGKAIALTLLDAGAKVVVCGRNQELLNEYNQPNVLPIKADVSKPNEVDQIIKQVLDKWGRIDILVNNAGITRDGLLMRMSDEDWQQVLDVNLSGAFYLCRSAIRPMMKQRSGKIVNISSVIGVTGNPGQINYAAAKAGLIGLTKSLAKEVASRGILVNAVAPGYIDTDMTNQLSEQQKEAIVKMIPLGRTGTVEDVAQLVYFLVSDANKYITGQTIHVDGGLVI